MSRMMHNNADISYSSINAPNYNSNRKESCIRSCFLNLPYATITSTFLVISGLLISCFSILHMAGVFDRLSQDLFYKRYLWLNELRVVMWFIGGVVLIIIITNLLIGFATASATLSATKSGKTSCACTRHSTTNCLVRFVFALNQLIFIVVLLLLIVFCIFSFALYLLTTQCNDDTIRHTAAGAPIDATVLLNHHDQTAGFGAPEHSYPASSGIGNSINLRPFASALFFSGNETHLLLFRDNRLKTLCRDYVSTLTLYNLIALLGVALLFIGFHCYLINLTVNRIRIATYKKYIELLYLNGTELSTFNHDASYDLHGERF